MHAQALLGLMLLRVGGLWTLWKVDAYTHPCSDRQGGEGGICGMCSTLYYAQV